MKLLEVAGMVANVAVTGGTVLMEVGKYMESMQEAGGNGISKKDWVMAKAKELILDQEQGLTKWAHWSEIISSFIDSVKSLWNILTGRKIKVLLPE